MPEYIHSFLTQLPVNEDNITVSWVQYYRTLPVFEQTIIIPGITKDKNVERRVTEGGNEAIQSVLLKLSFESIISSL